MSRLAMWVATVGGLGYSPWAPGTVGTLAAVPLFAVLASLKDVSVSGYWLAVAAVIAAAVWAAGAAEQALGEHDSGSIVIDEVAGYVVASAWLDFSWAAAVLAFVLFRLFDIAKPFPISLIDRRVGGGFGVVADDLVAGLFAGVVATLLRRLT